jgi:hypothetical protein
MTFIDFVFVYGIIISVFISINCAFIIDDIRNNYKLTMKEIIKSFIISKGNPYFFSPDQARLNMAIWGTILLFINWLLIIVVFNK